jgi:hypothetical protein
MREEPLREAFSLSSLPPPFFARYIPSPMTHLNVVQSVLLPSHT